jgi:diguanylate cyclase (GGDEF)-like protein
VLDLSLAVVMSAWVFDIALSAVLNGGRFDFGFYFGRLYGLLAASFVLVVILLETSGLFNRLAETTAKLKGDLARLAHRDALTDLPNRGAFTEQLEETLEEASASGSTFALLHIDLDEFKEINDVFGPAIGDLLLRAVSYRLQATAGTAFLARMGSDEFSILCLTGGQEPKAASLVEELLAATAGAFEIEGRWLHVSLSIGVATFPDDGTDARTLLGNADAALIQAKAAGRGVAHFFDSATDRPVRETHALQNELRSAVTLNQLVVHYQPQATIEGEIFGFEALVRWQHPRRGLVPPGDFIALAERSGIISEIGEWVLREAAREAASWPSELQISVNLSPIQLSHERLPNLVHSILIETGLRPDRLELEVTEGALIRDPVRGIAILRRLRMLGVRISMDDFGTGYSCLSSLQSFPFDKIKIDGGFVAGLGTRAQSRAIVRAVIGLGRTLDTPVIAEGVETEEQRLFLKQEGCGEIQGYLIGRPAPIAVYAEWAFGTRQAARA